MRKILFAALAVCIPLLAWAQQPQQFTAETDHYRVVSDTSQSQAEVIAHEMEAALALYNGIFHFDLALLPAKFNVKIFKDEAAFNAYLSSVISRQELILFLFLGRILPSRSSCASQRRRKLSTPRSSIKGRSSFSRRSSRTRRCGCAKV